MNVIDFETTGKDDDRKDLPISIGALIADFKDELLKLGINRIYYKTDEDTLSGKYNATGYKNISKYYRSGSEKKFKLTIELVPLTVWYSSLYKYYKNNNQMIKWSKIKGDLFKNEGRKCWICGDENERLEAHEFWEYKEEKGKHIQRLLGIHHLCFLCHKIKHIGFAGTENGLKDLHSRGYTFEDLIKHFCKINNCSREDFRKHHSDVFKTWGNEIDINGNKILVDII